MRPGKVGRTGVMVVAVMVALLLLGALACATTPAATKDFTVTSSIDFDHSHNVTIAGADVDNPPAEKTLASTEAGAVTHTHTITLAKADYESLKAGKEIAITSSAFPANNHTHTFTIKKPATSGGVY